MSKSNSDYIVGIYWLDKRRDGKSPKIWQIAQSVNRTIVYRSTRCESLDDAKAELDAYVSAKKALTRQEPTDAEVLPMLMAYWHEHGKKTVNCCQTGRSLRTFMAFLEQDEAGSRAVVTDLTPVLFERFREWRMAEHSFKLPWGAKQIDYDSAGVSGATVQRNINDIRAAVHHAEANMRISKVPRIKNIDQRYQSPPRQRLLTLDEMAMMVWYSSYNVDLFRYLALMIATAVRPDAALRFDPNVQYDPNTHLIDLQPKALPQTKKRNAIIPAIRPLRPVLRAWALEAPRAVTSRKKAWRTMRRVLNLSEDVHAKTIRHTVATLLYADQDVLEREVVELLGHDGKLARTTRIYAKYNPNRLANACAVLERLWCDIHRRVRVFDADHMLTTGTRGNPVRIVRRQPR